jgi:hypothetical protein
MKSVLLVVLLVCALVALAQAPTLAPIPVSSSDQAMLAQMIKASQDRLQQATQREAQFVKQMSDSVRTRTCAQAHLSMAECGVMSDDGKTISVLASPTPKAPVPAAKPIVRPVPARPTPPKPVVAPTR